MLQASEASAEARLFAATTLKGKVGFPQTWITSLRSHDVQITYDLHQIPRESLPQLRETLLQLLSSSAAGPKPIRTQLCVCLAVLAIQMLEWKDVISLVVSRLGGSIPAMLEFLHVLPEEVTEGRKINLSVCQVAAISARAPLAQDGPTSVSI